MNRLMSQIRPGLKDLVRRLDRVAGHLNLVLGVLAIGLATLDVTFFLTQQVVDHLPPVTRVVYVEKTAN